jgi:hypothetical protein
MANRTGRQPRSNTSRSLPRGRSEDRPAPIIFMDDDKEPEKDDTPDTPPTEPEPVPIKEPPPPPEKQGPYIA